MIAKVIPNQCLATTPREPVREMVPDVETAPSPRGPWARRGRHFSARAARLARESASMPWTWSAGTSS